MNVPASTSDFRLLTSNFLPLPELHPYPALDAADYTGDSVAVSGELAREVPGLRVRELPVHLTVFHREALERFVDLVFLRKRRPDQFADDGAIRVLGELQLDVVIDRGDARPPYPASRERARNAGLHLNRRNRFRLRIRTLEARRRDIVRHYRVALMAGVLP